MYTYTQTPTHTCTANMNTNSSITIGDVEGRKMEVLLPIDTPNIDVEITDGSNGKLEVTLTIVKDDDVYITTATLKNPQECNVRDSPSQMQSETETNGTDVNLCKICYDKRSEYMYLKCGHFCICRDCISYPGMKRKCPICRANTIVRKVIE